MYDLPDRVLVGLNQAGDCRHVFPPAEASTTISRRSRIVNRFPGA
ncbi:hypothetical protein ACLQ3H_15835 [Micromonospora saelicesensis]|nr:hypothetical protein [Micromonospora sp. U21]